MGCKKKEWRDSYLLKVSYFPFIKILFPLYRFSKILASLFNHHRKFIFSMFSSIFYKPSLPISQIWILLGIIYSNIASLYPHSFCFLLLAIIVDYFTRKCSLFLFSATIWFLWLYSNYCTIFYGSPTSIPLETNHINIYLNFAPSIFVGSLFFYRLFRWVCFSFE